MEKPLFPQALATSFTQRVKNENTALYITTQTARGTKRSATVVNYSEDFFAGLEDGDDDARGSGNGYGDDRENGAYDDDDEYNPHKRNNGYSYGGRNHNVTNALLTNFTGKTATKTPHEQYSEYEVKRAAATVDNLVPIRINIEHQSSRIVDFFMWNLNETLVTPESFAKIMCHDLELPASVQNIIVNAINTQCEEYTQLSMIELPDDLSIHVIVELSVNLDKQLYEDKFEWDLNSELKPEEFAEIVVADMGISREFYPAIAHALHESILKMKREAIEGRLPHEIPNGAAFGLEAGWRFDPENLGQEWSPSVETLSQWEIEKREIERERNIRRLKRESMRVDDVKYKRRGARRYDELTGTWSTI